MPSSVGILSTRLALDTTTTGIIIRILVDPVDLSVSLLSSLSGFYGLQNSTVASHFWLAGKYQTGNFCIACFCIYPGQKSFLNYELRLFHILNFVMNC